jgi:hypothetical protein
MLGRFCRWIKMQNCRVRQTDARTDNLKNPKKKIQKKYVRTDERTNGQTDERTDGRMDRRTNGRTNGQMDERTQRGVTESASQITGAECRVRQTHAQTH